MTARTADRHSASLRYPGSSLRVATSDAADLQWLLEFVRPDFDDGEFDPHARVAVSMLRDAERFDRLLRSGQHASEHFIDCFSLDGRMEPLPLWKTTDENEAVVFDRRIEALYCRDAASGCVTIVAPPARAAARIALLRVVRELAAAAFVSQGGVVLHAATAAWSGRGIAIAGPKRQGKTTLLLHLMFDGGAAFVSGDRSAIARSRVALSVRGMPTIATVRRSTLEILPSLAGRFAGSRDHHRFLLDEAGDDDVASESYFSLSPAQLVRVVGSRRSGPVALAAIVFPQQTSTAGGIVLRELSRADARERLRQSIFRSEGTPANDRLFPGGDSADWPDDWPDVRCFACELGVDAYAPGSAAALLAEATG